MARLPTPGGDSGNWGTILNTFLSQVHASDGTLKTDSVTSDAIAPNAVTSSALAPNAVDAITIADGSITEVLLDTAVQTKLNEVAPVTSVASKTGAVSLTKTDVGLDQVDNTSDATKNAATATLTNKTISGANNTITDLPASATPDAARLVVTTASGGGTTENGANTWAKIATIEITELYKAVNLLLSVSGARNNTASSDSAVIAVYAEVNFNTPGIANRSNVDIIASSGSTFGPDSFKIISDGYGSPYQLWMRKTSTFGGFRVTEINRAVSPTGVTLTYHDGATWQSATPTGAVTNVQSNGVTAFGTPVVTTSGTQTLSNKTISGASNTLSNIPQSAVTNLTSDLSNTYSQLKTRIQAGNNIVTNPNYENTSLIQNYGVLSTTQKRSGAYSFKITGTGALQYPALTTTATEYVRINVRQGQKFYYEFWIYGDDANTITSGTSELISLGLWFYDAAGVYQTNVREWTKGTGDTIGVGSWAMISGTLTVPANSNITNMGPLFYVTGAMTAGNSYYIDDVVLREVTEVGNTNQALYGTDTPAATVLQSALPATSVSTTGTQTLTNKTISGSSNTLSNIPQSAVTNLSTDISKQVSMLSTVLSSGVNLLPNGGFEDSNFWIGPSAVRGYSTEQKHSGTQSLKIQGYSWTNMIANSTSFMLTAPCFEGDKFYCEAWVYGHASNIETNPGHHLYMQMGWYGPGGYISSTIPVTGYNGAGVAYNGVWTKISGYATAPANTTAFDVTIVQLGGTDVTGNTYYWDDVKCIRVTESIAINQALYASNTPAATVLQSALPATSVSTTGTQTLTNKTLTNPRINTIIDTGGATSIVPYPVASAVNYLQVVAGTTGNGVSLQSQGSDTNVAMHFWTKGTGAIVSRSLTNGTAFAAQPVASGVNHITAYGATTTNAPYFIATGSDANIPIGIYAKGTSGVRLGNSSGNGMIVGTPASTVNYVYASGSATGNAVVVSAGGSDTNIDLNLAGQGTGTVKINNTEVATISSTQTFTNKTLNNPLIVSSLRDANGSTLLGVTAIASAVNYIDIKANASGFAPAFSASGADVNINLDLNPKGAGQVRITGVPVVTETKVQALTNKTLSSPKIDYIKDLNDAISMQIVASASAVNYLAIRNRATGGYPSMEGVGSDTNVGINFSTKGAGTFSYTVPSGQTTATLQANSVDANINLNLVSKGTGTVQANGNPVGIKVAVPASASSAGEPGQWAADANHHYTCIATNTWVRSVAATW